MYDEGSGGLEFGDLVKDRKRNILVNSIFC